MKTTFLVGYNPCFSGSSSATKFESTNLSHECILVTILVFLAALVQLQERDTLRPRIPD